MRPSQLSEEGFVRYSTGDPSARSESRVSVSRAMWCQCPASIFGKRPEGPCEVLAVDLKRNFVRCRRGRALPYIYPAPNLLVSSIWTRRQEDAWIPACALARGSRMKVATWCGVRLLGSSVSGESVTKLEAVPRNPHLFLLNLLLRNVVNA